MVLRNIVEGVDLVEAETVSVAVEVSGEDVTVVVIGIEVLVAMAIMIGEVEVVLKVVSGVAEEILEVVSIVEDHGVGTIGNTILKAVKLTGLKDHGVAKVEKIVGLRGAKEILTKGDRSIARR